MSSMQELRAWVKVEHKQAEHNANASRTEQDGFYHRYNTGRAQALRGVLDKIDVLLSPDVLTSTKPLREQPPVGLGSVD